MSEINNNSLIIIPEGKYKGMRLYLEDKCGAEHILPIEMFYLFQNAFKNNYKVFFLKCIPNHSIIIPEKDLNFLKTAINKHDEEEYLKHYFSNNVLKIKKLQHLDILEIYKIAIKKNQISAFFLHPVLNTNFYCFNMFLIVKNNFDLNEILNLNLNLIKINSIIEYHPHTLTLEITKNIYDLLNVEFKDYIVPYSELKKTRPYDVFNLQEKKDLNILYDKKNEMRENNFKKDFSEIDERIKISKKKLLEKEAELDDMQLYVKLFSQKLCTQIFIFDEIILNDTIFFTNFIQLVGSASVNFEDDGININYDELQHYSLKDMYFNDEYRLYTVFHSVCH